MLNIISTCRDILCVDINVDKRCVDHSTSLNPNHKQVLGKLSRLSQPQVTVRTVAHKGFSWFSSK